MPAAEYILFGKGASDVDEAVRAKTKALADAVKESDAYKAWVKAREDVRERHAAQVMLRDLQRAQLELMRKAQAGETIGPEEEERWRRTVETIAYNPYVSAVLRAEQALSQLLAEIHQLLAQELGLLDEERQQADDDDASARGRLWVPGQP